MKAATIKDVAKKAEVSISVVSYVLNNNPKVSISKETKDRVLAAAKSLNYIPNSMARSMRTNKSMVIGLATFWDVSDSVFTDILKGVDSIAGKNGYSVTYCNIKNDFNGTKIIELYSQRQIDGIILLLHVDPDKNFSESKFINKIKQSCIPTVIIDGNTQDPDMSYVYIDYYGTSYTAVNYLYKLGHRNFCYMLPDQNEMSNIQAAQRICGYKDALKNLNLIDQGLYFNKQSIYDAIDALISETSINKPTAIVVNKIRYAVPLIKMLLEEGIKIPDDISIIACNDQNYAEFLTPSITTIKVPIYEMGQKGAAMLFDILQDVDTQKVKLKLPNVVVERESCMRLSLS